MGKQRFACIGHAIRAARDSIGCGLLYVDSGRAIDRFAVNADACE